MLDGVGFLPAVGKILMPQNKRGIFRFSIEEA